MQSTEYDDRAAPTPDLSLKMIEATIRDLRFQSAAYETGDDASFTNSVADMLEALSADRAQALAALAKETDHCRETARALRQMTARWDQARQMLAKAPHGESCVANVWTDDEQPFDARPCDCWKTDL